MAELLTDGQLVFALPIAPSRRRGYPSSRRAAFPCRRGICPTPLDDEFSAGVLVTAPEVLADGITDFLNACLHTLTSRLSTPSGALTVRGHSGGHLGGERLGCRWRARALRPITNANCLVTGTNSPAQLIPPAEPHPIDFVVAEPGWFQLAFHTHEHFADSTDPDATGVLAPTADPTPNGPAGRRPRPVRPRHPGNPCDQGPTTIDQLVHYVVDRAITGVIANDTTT